MDDVAQSKPVDPTPPHGADRKVPKVGDAVVWKTLGGDKFVGRVIELDSNVAIVELPDGTRKAVEC